MDRGVTTKIAGLVKVLKPRHEAHEAYDTLMTRIEHSSDGELGI